jgi:hypothetical protein
MSFVAEGKVMLPKDAGAAKSRRDGRRSFAALW